MVTLAPKVQNDYLPQNTLGIGLLGTQQQYSFESEGTNTEGKGYVRPNEWAAWRESTGVIPPYGEDIEYGKNVNYYG